jgi:hypothetical protein
MADFNLQHLTNNPQQNDISFRFENGERWVQKSIPIKDLITMRIKYLGVPGQRGFIYSENKSKSVIESIFQQRYLGSFLLRYVSHITGPSYTDYDYHIYEGQQRGNSILKFINGEFNTPNGLKILINGEILDISDISYDELKNSDHLKPAYERFINFGIMTEIKVMTLKECVDNYVATNQNGVKLVSAEVRNGKFSKYWELISSFGSRSRINVYNETAIMTIDNKERYRFDDDEQHAKHAQLWYSMNSPNKHQTLSLNNSILDAYYDLCFSNECIFNDDEYKLRETLFRKGKALELSLINAYGGNKVQLSKGKVMTLAIIIGFVISNKQLRIKTHNYRKIICWIMETHKNLIDKHGHEVVEGDIIFSQSCKSNKHSHHEMLYRINKLRESFDLLVAREKLKIGSSNLDDEPIIVEVDKQRAFSLEQKTQLYDLTTGKCNGCSGVFDIEQLDADHIINHSDGGPTTILNAQLLCKKCHAKKTHG